MDYATFRIFATPHKEWVLGGAFLNDYYQVYSVDRNQVGLVPSTLSNGEPDLLALNPPWSKDDTMANIMELASCLGVVVLTVLIRNTCVQNASSAKVRFHNLGFCDETGDTPVQPNRRRDILLEDTEAM